VSAFPDNWHDAIKAEPVLDRMLEKFCAAYPLGPEGERLLAEMNEQSRLASTGEWNEDVAGMVSALNEASVREQLGLPQIPTP
jgi:hypothetical protein